MKSIDDIARKNPFRVPENYFEGVNERIFTATADKKNAKLTVVHRRRRFLLVAASFSGLVLLSYIAYRLFVPLNNDMKLSEAVKGNNIEVLMNELDINLIEENTKAPEFTVDASDVSSSAIIDYLSKENIDLNEIYERL